MKQIPRLLLAVTLFTACTNQNEKPDASGTFEAVETIVSAEATGTIKVLKLEEGQNIKAGEVVGYIDSTQLFLKKKQLQAQINALLSRKPNVNLQIAALYEQLRQAEREQKRTANLVKADAATPKQLDDVNAQVAVIKKQIAAQQSSLNISTESITEESVPLSIQIEQLDDQLKKCKIINPINGTVITKYAEVGEGTVVGKPIYKIAAIDEIILRAYLTNTQLSKLKIGQQVNILVDDTKDTYKTYIGTLEWVSNKAEFTPKTIQTKEERANLVYAIKVKVRNDGLLKIGMYADLKL